jgi:tetratricopeptide (TPR) repeat protein
MTVGEDRTALVAGVVPGLTLPAQDGALADILADLPAPGAAIGAETARLNRLALANVSARQYAEAIGHLQRVLSLDPDSVATHHNLGVTLALAKRAAEAEVHYRKAIALNPKWVPAWMNLAALLSQRYEFAAAIACYDKVTALEPGNVASLNNAALLLRRTGQFEAARARFARALGLAPADPRTRFNHATVEDTAASRREAIDTGRQCLEQDPHSASLLSNLAICHQMVGEFDEAFAFFERAIAADREFHEAWFNRSLLRLSLGDFAAGWAEYEHRWQLPQMATEKPDFAQKMWNGEALDGKTILIYSEQGHGDAIQFLRYVPQVAARGGRIVLRVERSLIRLAASVPGDMMIISPGQRLPKFDVWCPLLSLPRVLETRLETIPGAVPYLSVRPALAERWRRRLADLPGRRVGLAWAGDPRHINDFRRSIALQRLMPLLRVPRISWVGLQVGPRAGDLAGVGAPEFVDISAQLGDFAETAGVIANLDLVVTADTAVAHLAGAIAKPVWTLLPFSPDWRWMLKREDSPWYPTMRLFRQPAPGDWDSVIGNIREALAQHSG